MYDELTPIWNSQNIIETIFINQNKACARRLWARQPFSSSVLVVISGNDIMTSARALPRQQTTTGRGIHTT